jgi:hypothetical protein
MKPRFAYIVDALGRPLVVEGLDILANDVVHHLAPEGVPRLSLAAQRPVRGAIRRRRWRATGAFCGAGGLIRLMVLYTV